MRIANPNRKVLVIPVLFFVLSVFLYCIHFICYRYSYPSLSPDEASFLSPAYDLITKGQFSTSVHQSFLPGADQYTYWMPPLFMVVLAGYLKVVGFSFTKAKLFSFLCFSVSGLLLSRVGKNWSDRFWILSLLFCCPFVIIASTTIRMEAIGFLITCLSIVAIREQYNGAVLGLLAGLTVMVHPVFLACGVAIGLTVLRRRNVGQILLFTALFLLTISPYVWYIELNPALFYEQMTLQLHRKASRELLTIDPVYIGQFLPLSLLAFFLLYRLRGQRELAFFLTVGLLLVDLLLLKSQEFNYHLNIIPYVLTAIVLHVDERAEPAGFGWNRQLIFLLVNVLFLGLLYQKEKKNDFLKDDTIYELVQTLNAYRPYWQDQAIYVAGTAPDLTTFLLLKHQRVERVNGVLKYNTNRWHTKFDCVVNVQDKAAPVEHRGVFWSKWRRVVRYRTRNDQYTLSLYRR